MMLWPKTPSPFRTTARMTALRPGQSPPPVRMPIRMSSPPPVPPPDSLRQLMPALIAVDAGTTGVRAFAVDGEGRPMGFSYRELTQYFPRPGWVEHDPEEIWTAVQTTLAELAGRLAADGVSVAAVGITNQRETVVAWDRRSGRPLHRALVWQDRRTADRCDALREAGHEPAVRAATGLVLDPYFSATKMEWLLRGDAVDGAAPGLALGTV